MTEAFVWSDARVRDALGLPPRQDEAGAGKRAEDTRHLAFSGISTDTRTAGRGELFVALVGEHFDGHDFLQEAVARELGGAVVSRDAGSGASLPLYRVEDTLKALGALARYRRRALPARVAAITGSSGKTTVKDLLAASLAGTFRVHATRGNLNNRVGVPLTLLAAPDDAEVVVVEMGTSVPGEIGALTAIAEPDAGVVTTVSEAHLEGLGSLQGVLEEKLALVRGAKPDAVLVVGDDPPSLPKRARELRSQVKVAGLSRAADSELRGDLLEAEPDGTYRIRFWGREIEAGLPGKHGAKNLVLALAMAKLLGADADKAVRGAASVQSGKLRNEIRPIGGLTLLLDCYNANPQSVEAALDLLGDLPKRGGRVAFLATMLELGEQSAELHRTVLERALSRPYQIVVAVGEFAAAAAAIGSARATTAATAAKAAPAAKTTSSPAPLLLAAGSPEQGYEALRPHLRGTETVLLKGSRGMALERLIGRFEQDFSMGPPRSGGRA